MLKIIIPLLLLLFSIELYALPEKVIIMRHGDKNKEDDANHNLDQKGFERSLKLPEILVKKFPGISAIFAPIPIAPKAKNIRAIQTITPYAVKTGINIDTSFKVGEENKLAEALLKEAKFDKKNILIVWEHNNILNIVKLLGAKDVPEKWKGKDFDSIIILSFKDGIVKVDYDKAGIE
jgi:phosphohistidine phosphatase SixA